MTIPEHNRKLPGARPGIIRAAAALALVLLPAAGAGAGGPGGLGGVILEATTAQLRAEHGLAPDACCALVTAVDPDSAAAAGGLSPGDVILRVGDCPVASPQDVAGRIAAARMAGKSGVALLVVRGRTTYYLALPLASR